MENIVKKLSEDELNELKALRSEYSRVTIDLGKISVQRMILARDLESLNVLQTEIESKYMELEKNEQILFKKIGEKYGDGQLDIDNGTVVIAPSK